MRSLRDLFKAGVAQTTSGFVTGNQGLSTLSKTTDEAKAHGYHKPYENDFKTAYLKVQEKKDEAMA